jgi:CRISPR-associated protein Cmr1
VALSHDGKQAWPEEERSFEEAFTSWFREHYERAAEDWPEWTAISRRTQVLMLRGRSSEPPLSLLDRVGKEMVRYRSWGKDGKILGGEAQKEQNFKGDHDLMKEEPRDRRQHPERIAFGLPHDYGNKGFQKVGPADKALDRRASPLFLHIHQTAEQMPPIAVVSFLPARFLPGERPRISVGGQAVPLAGLDELYRPVRDFLTRLAGGSECKEKFEVIGRIGMDSGGKQ